MPVKWQVGDVPMGQHERGVFTTPVVQYGTTSNTSAVYSPASSVLKS